MSGNQSPEPIAYRLCLRLPRPVWTAVAAAVLLACMWSALAWRQASAVTVIRSARGMVGYASSGSVVESRMPSHFDTWLQHTKITPAALGKLASLPKLVLLVVSDTGITEADLEIFREKRTSLGLPSVTLICEWWPM